VSDRMFPDRSTPGADNTVRKQHYGEGEQPWDVMLRYGWAPHFAAGCVLRYLRRSKDPEHSLESARWYWERLGTMASDVDCQWRWRAAAALNELRKMLTEDELTKVEDQGDGKHAA
jgi:hypothetical protein